jgi:hypothetical protein
MLLRIYASSATCTAEALGKGVHKPKLAFVNHRSTDMHPTAHLFKFHRARMLAEFNIFPRLLNFLSASLAYG